jgi:hypothetical protein
MVRERTAQQGQQRTGFSGVHQPLSGEMLPTRGRDRLTAYGGAVTPPSDADPELVPVPVLVVLPADPLLGTEQQELVARLWKRRQTETGWVYLVGLPSFRLLTPGRRTVGGPGAAAPPGAQHRRTLRVPINRPSRSRP